MNFSKIDIKDLAVFICEELKKSSIDSVLVGGACVSIYSHNRYQSYDLDFVTYEQMQSVEKVLKPLGFTRNGRCFTHKDCPFLIDFIHPPIAIGNESIQRFQLLKTSAGRLQLLTPTDCVKDRLAAFFHWKDEQSLNQALLVAKNHKIDIKDLKHWANKEGFREKMESFLQSLNQ